MKAGLQIGVFVLFSVLPVFGDSFKLTEVYADRLIRMTQDGVRSFDVVTTDSGAFSCNLHVDGLSSAQFDSNTVFSLSLGGYSFTATEGDASRVTAHAITFLETIANADTGKTKVTGRITFSRNGDILTVHATSSALDASIAAESFAGTTGAITGEVDFDVSAGDFDISGTVLIKGTTRVRTREAESNTFQLNMVRVTGAEVITRPSAIILSPKPGEQVSDDIVTVSVKASDLLGVASVAIWANDDDPVAAILNGTSWQADIGLNSGTNTIQAQATDNGGNVSRIASETVIAP
jgi:hypothetical protein